MSTIVERESRPLVWLPWSVWLLYLLSWSAGLLTPQPVLVAVAILPSRVMSFSFGLVHVCAYAAFAALSGWVPLARRHRWLLLAFLSAHAFATEFLQGFVPLRTPSWGDVGLDHLGIVLGLIACRKLWLADAERTVADN